MLRVPRQGFCHADRNRIKSNVGDLMKDWNWTPRAKALGAVLETVGATLIIWVGIWLLFTGQLPPNPLELP
jgi:hypothetical protein